MNSLLITPISSTLSLNYLTNLIVISWCHLGKLLFFPGRLIHTNEFIVLLGEGYYAERTAKQTVEILTRRGKALNSQAESLKANMKDLKAEASFLKLQLLRQWRVLWR